MIRNWMVGLLALALVASACVRGSTEPPPIETTSSSTTTIVDEDEVTTTTAPPRERTFDPDGLYLNLMWHQHQPLYPKDADGIVTRPWVRLHAAKDYFDMVALVAENPDVRVTFNLTPVLMLQLEELANGTKDVYQVLTEVPADQLDEAQQQFILDRFFDTNRKVIARFPRYQELLEMRDNGLAYTTQDFLDLQVLFNLAWTDPTVLAQEPLADLVSRGKDYAERDKDVVLAMHLRMVQGTIDAHRQLWDAGQIEVTTTPLAHPILPLIADTAQATIGDPAAVLPVNRFNELVDATDQVDLGLDEAERLLGRRPVGMWPGEGAVSQLVVPIFSGAGVEWIATGEDVLAPSLGLTSFTRDENDTVQEADLLYRPWLGVPRRNPALPIFFRDRVLSDLVGFQYSGMSAEAAVADFMDRLRDIEARLDEEGASGPHVVSVILDGENAWENYDNDGIDFLRALYTALGDADFIQTVTPSEYLEHFGDTVEPLDEVFAGAWFSSNYATWIGEEEEAVGWDYLAMTRQDLERARRNESASPEQLAAAYRTMLFAEGSDWFWWYGADQNSGNDDYFDAAFRELLGQVYDALGQDRPAFVDIPIIPESPVTPTVSGTDELAVTIDGVITADEWDAASFFDGEGRFAGVFYGFTPDGLQLRVDQDPAADPEPFEVWLDVPGSPTAQATAADGTVLGFGATHRYRWSPASPDRLVRLDPTSGPAADDLSGLPGAPAGQQATAVETTISLDDLGSLEIGDTVIFRIVGPDALFPAAGPLAAQVPDISNVEVFLTVEDPIGDDHGPGTYTYPRDAVFTAGSYDITQGTFGVEGGDLVVTLDVLAAIANPWDSPNGLSIQTFDIYINKDLGAGTGERLLIDGRNASFEDGYEYGITVEGWEPAIYVANADGRAEETRPTFKVITIGDKGRVVVRVPLELLGDGDPSEWAYAVALMSQEGFPSSGVRRVRDVLPAAEQWRIGGAPADTVNHTRILDVLYGVEGTQEELLSDFPPASDIADLGPDDFAVVPWNS